MPWIEQRDRRRQMQPPADLRQTQQKGRLRTAGPDLLLFGIVPADIAGVLRSEKRPQPRDIQPERELGRVDLERSRIRTIRVPCDEAVEISRGDARMKDVPECQCSEDRPSEQRDRQASERRGNEKVCERIAEYIARHRFKAGRERQQQRREQHDGFFEPAGKGHHDDDQEGDQTAESQKLLATRRGTREATKIGLHETGEQSAERVLEVATPSDLDVAECQSIASQPVKVDHVGRQSADGGPQQGETFDQTSGHIGLARAGTAPGTADAREMGQRKDDGHKKSRWAAGRQQEEPECNPKSDVRRGPDTERKQGKVRRRIQNSRSDSTGCKERERKQVWQNRDERYPWIDSREPR